MATSRETASQTLSSLEDRVRRIDYLLNGSTSNYSEKSTTSAMKSSAATRLRNLERSLHTLATKSPAFADVLALQNQHPDLFHSISTPTTLPPHSLASLILSHNQLYHSLSTRLAQLQDTSIPDPSTAAKLIYLRPRIDNVRTKQDEQVKAVAELRARSARLVEEWYESGVLGMGERWVEWEERLRDVEILVRRREAAKRREDGAV